MRQAIAWSHASVYPMVSNTTLFSNRSFVAWMQMFEWTRRILWFTDKLPIDFYWYIWSVIRSYWSDVVHSFSREVAMKQTAYKECYPKRDTAFLLMTSSDGNIFRVAGSLCGSPVTDEFLWQRPVTRSLEVFFHLRLKKRWSKQWWAGDLRRQRTHLRRHCNVTHLRWYLVCQ